VPKCPLLAKSGHFLIANISADNGELKCCKID